MAVSVKFTEAHFDAKAARYQAALRSAPHSRNFELLPFLIALNDGIQNNPKNLTVADLLCGGGYLTRAIRGLFRRYFGVDVSGEMLSYYPVGADVDRIKSPLGEQSATLTNELKPDIILSLAGLHHVYEFVDGEVLHSESESLQESLILGWAESLPPHGVMVIADVTSPDVSPFADTDDVNELKNFNESINERFEDLSEYLIAQLGENCSLADFPSKTFAAYSDFLQSQFPRVEKSQPGLWFRNVVAKRGLYGHTDYFLNAPKIVDALRTAGFRVSFYEFSTPWIFESFESFLFFFYEKFAFGPPVNSFNEIPSDVCRMIKSEAEKYLGISGLAGKAISAGWRLGYYVVKRNGDNQQ